MDILQNLVHMTGQRDHLRLEFSVLSTLLQLPHVTQVRALEIIPLKASSGCAPVLGYKMGSWSIPILIFCMTHNASL